MREQNLKGIITMGLILVSALVIVPISASEKWKHDNTGWWYSDSNSNIPKDIEQAVSEAIKSIRT